VWVWWPRYGPGEFTLWALLAALGFISAIGGVASWLLPADEPASVDEDRAPAPVRPSPRSSAPASSRARSSAAPAEFGRPAPDVAHRLLPRPEPRVAAVATANAGDAGPPEWSEAPEDQPPKEPVSSVLADLEGIERELAPRRGAPPAASA
jgi:hypothetical protein